MAAPSTFTVADMNSVFDPTFQQPQSEALKYLDSTGMISPSVSTAASMDPLVIDPAILRDEYLKAEREKDVTADWGLATLPYIKAELKKKGVAIGRGRKNELVAKLKKVLADESFPLFKKLPLELREKIWKAALPSCQVINIRSCEWHGILLQDKPNPLPFYISLACEEAYSVVDKVYRRDRMAKVKTVCLHFPRGMPAFC